MKLFFLLIMIVFANNSFSACNSLTCKIAEWMCRDMNHSENVTLGLGFVTITYNCSSFRTTCLDNDGEHVFNNAEEAAVFLQNKYGISLEAEINKRRKVINPQGQNIRKK